MSEIRPMRREEIPQIAALYRFVDRSDWRIPPDRVQHLLDSGAVMLTEISMPGPAPVGTGP